MHTITSEIKPGVRQSTEETLVDMANLIATLVATDVHNNVLGDSQYPALLARFQQLRPQAKIWGLNKNNTNQRIYITNKRGMVILDSSGQELGADFSQWNDVYLTLRGQYGARSTMSDPNNELSTVMHVAAPIMFNNDIIGVVTVAKANSNMQPFIERSQQRLIKWSIIFVILAISIGALLAWRITQALSRLSHYAEQVIRGDKIPAPRFRIFYEFGELALVLERMRQQLEGKNYAERYVQTLTHELKSPLAAIKGASEILQSELSDHDKYKFLNNIENQSERLQLIIDRMLTLSIVEQQQTLQQPENISLSFIINDVESALSARIKQKNIRFLTTLIESDTVLADRFLLQQALFNLTENALDFTSHGAAVSIICRQTHSGICLEVINEGMLIPDYALPRLCERFYSLPRPDSGLKSTGLGLNFVVEIAQLHHAQFKIANTQSGVCASLSFKTQPKATKNHLKNI